MAEERHASYLWQVLRPDIQIQDPDGWDRTDLEWSWYQQQITESEYKERLSVSTVEIAEMTPQAQSLLGYTKSPTTAYDYIEDRNGQESTTKEQKKVTTFNVTFTAEKTVRQEISADVNISTERLIELLQNELDAYVVDSSDIDTNGSDVYMNLELSIDMEREVREAVNNGDYENVEITIADLDDSEVFDEIDEDSIDFS